MCRGGPCARPRPEWKTICYMGKTPIEACVFTMRDADGHRARPCYACQRISEAKPGQVVIVKKGGKAVKVVK